MVDRASPDRASGRLAGVGLRLALAAALVSVLGAALGCAHAVGSKAQGFTGPDHYDFCAKRARPERFKAPEDPADDEVVIRYLGAGGLYIAWQGEAVMTGPFFSNPGTLRVGFGHVRPDVEAIEDGLKGVPVEKVGAILVGHSHYDHLGDLPAVAKGWAPGASLWVNRSGKRALAGYSELTRRITTLEDVAGRWIRLHDASGSALPFRLLTVPSDHAPHVRGMLVMDGESEEIHEPWKTTGYWALRTGRTYAFVLDLLDPPVPGVRSPTSETVRFRILLQDAASPAPADLLPPAGEDGTAYDLAVLCMPSADLVPPYPREVLRRTVPRYALVTHYENFFAPWGRSCHFAPFLSEKKASRFLEATDEALRVLPDTTPPGAPVGPVVGPAGERWAMPRVGEWLVFRPPIRTAGTDGGTP